jgi:DNA polymerase-1
LRPRLETNGLDTRVFDGVCKTFIVGWSISYDGVTGYYIPVNHGIEDDLGKFQRNPKWSLPFEEVKAEIQRLIDNTITILHNCMFDHEMMQGWGIKIRELLPDGKTPAFHDTLLLAYVIDCGRKQKGLKVLSETLLGMKMLELEGDVFAKGEDIKFQTLDPTEDKAVVYAASDAICTFLLYGNLCKEGVETDKRKSIYNVERKCTIAIREMERTRVRTDINKLREYKVNLEALRSEIEREANEVYGETVNLGSPAQVGEILFEKYGLTDLQERDDKGELVFNAKNKKPTINTDEDSISKFKDRCPLIPLILLHRNISKTSALTSTTSLAEWTLTTT